MEKSLPSKTLAPLWILQILQKYSDCDHLLEQKYIIQKLKADYGVIVERKTVSRNINNLMSAGYDIEYVIRKECRGYYLANKQFEDDELQLLIDSVLFSRHISDKYAQDLIDKLIELGGPSLIKSTRYLIKSNKIERENNKELFLNINTSNKAISNQHKLSFICNIYGCDKQLHPVWDNPVTVNPLRLTVARNHYYLIAIIDGNDCPTNFRLDKLTQLTILNDTIDKTAVAMLNNDTLDDYLRSHPFMYCGDSQTITLKADKIIFDDIIDTFGKDYSVLEQDETTATITLRANEYDIVEWALQNAAFVEILSPKHSRNGMIKNAQILTGKYLNSTTDETKEQDLPRELDKK